MMVLDPARVVPSPWRNGGGATRELAVSTAPCGNILWRISVADLDRDAAFSVFPGMDRLFTALGTLRLIVDGSPVDMLAGCQMRFTGETPVSVSLPAPTRALNVMTRRGFCHAEVALRRAHPASGESAPEGSAVATVDLDEVLADVRLFLLPKDPR
ncbi:HutD family protein [Nocardia africana]|uniref:HutD family protein n=1 Tax=Nocardia africana TaxID=134964 RepID=A0ABW6NCQ2_9NOCA